MNPVLTFIFVCLFLGTLGGVYLLSEVNISRGSFSVRKRVSDAYTEGLSFTLWFYKKESDLVELYSQEVCEDMQLSFDEFCFSVFYDHFRIIYKK